jgi:hypothetical protein
VDMPPHLPPEILNVPTDNLPLEYWKAEAEYRKSRFYGTIGEVLVELVQLLVLGLSLPVRLPISWWLKQRRKGKREVTL